MIHLSAHVKVVYMGSWNACFYGHDNRLPCVYFRVGLMGKHWCPAGMLFINVKYNSNPGQSRKIGAFWPLFNRELFKSVEVTYIYVHINPLNVLPHQGWA